MQSKVDTTLHVAVFSRTCHLHQQVSHLFLIPVFLPIGKVRNKDSRKGYLLQVVIYFNALKLK